MNQDCVKILETLPVGLEYSCLVDWIRNEAGSSNKNYFHCNKSGGLKLQQVPEEYANVLLEITKRKPSSYLEVGIGNGGSWLAMSYVLKNILKVSHAVDNLAYYQSIGQKIEEVDFIVGYLSSFIQDVKFYNMDSQVYFANHCEKFDVIFIDGDHGYDGVMGDYKKALDLIEPGGVMIFHDVVSVGAPGVVQFWGEIKHNHVHKEFISSNTCGMGLLFF